MSDPGYGVEWLTLDEVRARLNRKEAQRLQLKADIFVLKQRETELLEQAQFVAADAEIGSGRP